MKRREEGRLELDIASGISHNPFFKFTDKILEHMPYVIGTIAIGGLVVFAGWRYGEKVIEAVYDAITQGGP